MDIIVFNLRNIIDSKGLKYKSVAELSGIPIGRFYRIVQGAAEITCDEIASMCKALHITPNELFDTSKTA